MAVALRILPQLISHDHKRQRREVPATLMWNKRKIRGISAQKLGAHATCSWSAAHNISEIKGVADVKRVSIMWPKNDMSRTFARDVSPDNKLY